VRLPRGQRFISINANNYLAVRTPAWEFQSAEYDADILLIWPEKIPPSFASRSEFRDVISSTWKNGSFKDIPYTLLPLTWDGCLSLSSQDWRIFRNACHKALTLVQSRRWPSNVIV